MAKRQKRIPGHEIHPGVKHVLGQPVNLVTKAGKVFFVNIIKIEASSMVVTDQKNGRQNIFLKDIQEIIIDYVGDHYAETSAH